MVSAACKLVWVIYIYRSFPVRIRIQCDSTPYVFPVHVQLLCFIQVQGLMCYSSSVKEIFILSVNHGQFPSMPLTQKSKHNNSALIKWMQILAGKNSLEQQPNTELKFRKSNKEENDSKKPYSGENNALPSEEEAVEATTTTYIVQTAVTAVFFFAASVFNSFFNAEGQNTAITMRTNPMKRGNCIRFEKMQPTELAINAVRRGNVFLEVCSRNSAYVLQCNDWQQELYYSC